MENYYELQKYNIHNTHKFSLNGFSTIARLVDIIDGDTIICIIPCFGKYFKFHIRLNGIDTCESKSLDSFIKNKAICAKNKIFEYICENTTLNFKDYLFQNCILVWLECKDFDKYGRLLANVFKTHNNKSVGQSISELLLSEKLAYEYHGERKLTEDEIKKLLDY